MVFPNLLMTKPMRGRSIKKKDKKTMFLCLILFFYIKKKPNIKIGKRKRNIPLSVEKWQVGGGRKRVSRERRSRKGMSLRQQNILCKKESRQPWR